MFRCKWIINCQEINLSVLKVITNSMRYVIILFFIFFSKSLAQTTPCFSFNENEFVISGDAFIIDENTIRLTEAIGDQAGFIWSQNLVNFDQDFSIEAELFLGNQDFGADGIAFVIQSISNDEGTLGGGIGYSGISPSIAIEFDTWWNSGNDPVQDDHIALIANGEPESMSAHSAYVPYTSVNNLENGNWHPISINWDGTEKNLSLFLNSNLIFSTNIDIPNLFFEGNSNLYWGFTAATGGANNLQQVKILEYCSFDSSCETASPNADSPQIFCNSISLYEISSYGENIRYYLDASGDFPLEDSTEINENTTIYITQTIDDCESQDLVEVEIIIENPNIYSENLNFIYCQNNSSSVNLFDSSNIFLSSDFSGFFYSINDAENLTNNIINPSNFEVLNENLIVYGRLENAICYDIYPVLLISESCDIIIPEGISPNNDGFNDVFEIQNLYNVYLNHSLKIYNRYGTCVFEGDNNLKWNGRTNKGDLLPVGTYFYVLKLNDEDSNVFSGWVYSNY